MRAVAISRFGGPEVLEVVDLPEPHAGAGEVRIRVAAAAVNPTDTGLRSGWNRRPLESPAPHVPGMDAAGTIDEVGEGVSWSVGDEVMAIVLPTGPRGGAYASLVVVPADSITHIPLNASLIEASTLPMNGLTVVDLTTEETDLPANLVPVVTGFEHGQPPAVAPSRPD